MTYTVYSTGNQTSTKKKGAKESQADIYATENKKFGGAVVY